jgi:TetR/AcrR family transcriptional regulator, transcriptional repressor for nem operon
VPKQPKTPASREESARQTKESLVKAALKLFAKDGLDAPSLDAICDEAGYTRGAFYVHFPDRDALLVAVMEKVGESFLASVFKTQTESSPTTTEPSVLIAAAQRFMEAVAAGSYPLMPGKTKSVSSVQIRPHQLLDACVRSKQVRDRYKALVEASIAHVAFLTQTDQAQSALRQDVDPQAIGQLLLSLVVGAQTLAELGIPLDPEALTKSVFTMLRAAQREEQSPSM